MRHRLQLLPLAMILSYVLFISTGCSVLTADASPLKASARKSPRTSTVVVTTTALPAGTANSSYFAALSATGGSAPYTWKLTSGVLPAGVTLSPAGVLSGTPTTGGSATFTVQALDCNSPALKGSASLTIPVVATTASPLTISTTSLVGGTVNTAYSSTLSASGGTSPYTWSIIAGQLPAGLSLTSGGTIIGTPTASGQFNFTIQAADAAATVQKASMALSLSIVPAPTTVPALAISTGSLPGGTVNASYTGTLSATGGTSPYSWSLASGQLPTGVTLSASGTITGVPTAGGQFSFAARVSDSSSAQQNAVQNYTISIASTSNSAGPLGTAGLLSGSTPSSYTVPTGWNLFAKENFESGACAAGSWCGGNFVSTQYHNDGDPTHSHALSCTYGNPTGNCGGLNWNKFLPVGTREVYVSFYEWLDTSFRMNDEMFLMRFHWDTGNGQPMFREAILDYFQNSTGTYNSSDATLLWNIQGQPYYQNKLPGNQRNDQTNWTIATGRWVQHEMYTKFSTVSGTIPISAAVTVNAAAKTYSRSSGSWIADGVTVGSSPHFKGFANTYNNGDGASGGGATSYFVTAVTDTVMTVDDGNGLLANEGPVSGLSYQIDHADGAYSYYKDGVRVAYQTNMINPGKVDFSTSNTTLSLMESYSKLIWHAPVNGSCETQAPFKGTCSTRIGNGACGYEYLPFGWNTAGYTKSSATSSFDTPIDCSTTVGGPMANPPVFNRYLDDVIVLTKSTTASAASTTLLAVNTSSLPTGSVGNPYSASLSASGGSTPYNWSVAAGQLPTGLTLSSSGLLSGTPTASGQFSFTVQVIDSSSTQQKATAAYSLSVAASTTSALAISTTSLPSGTVNSSYYASLSAKGGVAPYTWSLAAGQLPPGVALTSNGQLSGIPTTSSSYNLDAMATDQAGQSTTQPLVLDVASGAPSNGIQPISLTTSSDSYAHYWNFDFPGYAGFKFGDGTGSLLCPNGNNACQGVMGFWDLKNDPSKQYNYGAFDTGMFEHQWNGILNANGTGRGGSTNNEFKEAGGSDQTFTVVEQNNVRVKIVQSGPMHPYGDHTYAADPNLSMTKTYVFYRQGTGGAKVYTTTTLNYDGLDGMGPLNLQHNWGYSKIGWGRVSGEPVSHNDLGCGIMTTLTPTPWQVIYQAPGDYRYKDWMLFAPTAPNGGASEQITALSCATPNGPTPGHIYKCNSPSANGCGSTTDLGAVVNTNFLQIEREAQGSYMPLGANSLPIYFQGGLRFNWTLPSRSLAPGVPQTWQSVGFLGDNGIRAESVANTYSSEYKAPPSLSVTAGTGGSFDAVEGYWKLTSANNVLAFSANGDLHSPALQVQSWTGSVPSTLRVGSSTLNLNVDYVAVVNNNALLVQILRTIPSGTLVQIP
jgi:hypothetical protein